MGLAPQYPSWVIGLRTERHMMAAADKYPQAFQHCRARDVRFGSKADMCGAKRHVRFTPNSDRKSGLPLYRRKRTCAAHKLMSALGQKRTSRDLIRSAGR